MVKATRAAADCGGQLSRGAICRPHIYIGNFQYVEQLNRHPLRVPILYVTHRKLHTFAVKVEAKNGAFYQVNGRMHRFNGVIISF